MWIGSDGTVEIWATSGPVGRIAALDTPVPFSPPLEERFLPNVADVVREARSLKAY